MRPTKAFLLSLLYASCSFAAILYTDPDGLLPINFIPTRVGTTSTLPPVITLVRRDTAPASPQTATFSNAGGGPFSRVGSGVQAVNPLFSLIPLTGTPVSQTYQFAPTSRGAFAQAETVSVTGSATASHAFTLNGSGIGPVYNDVDFNPGDVISFGDVLVGNTSNTNFGLGNSTTDQTLLGLLISDPRLLLTVVAYSITGPDAAYFTANFVNGATFAPGSSTNYLLGFTPDAYRTFNATLTLFTDENAALGGSGSQFVYGLTGTGVPEPSSLLLSACGLALAAYRMRKSR